MSAQEMAPVYLTGREDGPAVLFEDADILVCEKPAGLATESGLTGGADLAGMLRLYLKEKNGGAGAPYLGLVHRLDQPVRGLLVFAKTKRAAADLGAQVTDGRMEKTYLAMVRLPEDKPDEARLEDYLARDRGGSRIAAPGEAEAKRAVLSYRVLERTGDTGLLMVRLETGRRHQIRVQLSAAGMPILGDRRYGSGGDYPFPALCSARLCFDHPCTRRRMAFEKLPSGGAWAESPLLKAAPAAGSSSFFSA